MRGLNAPRADGRAFFFKSQKNGNVLFGFREQNLARPKASDFSSLSFPLLRVRDAIPSATAPGTDEMALLAPLPHQALMRFDVCVGFRHAGEVRGTTTRRRGAVW